MKDTGSLQTLLISTALLLGFAAVAAAGPGGSQRTGDGMTPAEETVCDGDPHFGLCNAYCEALDCDSGDDRTPAAERACQRVLNNYFRHTGGVPPCECPCGFNLNADIQRVEDAGIPYPDPAAVGPLCQGTFDSFEQFMWSAQPTVAPFQPLNASILYQVFVPAPGQGAANCTRELEIDALEGGDPVDESDTHVLTESEAGACLATLDMVCDRAEVTDNRSAGP